MFVPTHSVEWTVSWNQTWNVFYSGLATILSHPPWKGFQKSLYRLSRGGFPIKKNTISFRCWVLLPGYLCSSDATTKGLAAFIVELRRQRFLRWHLEHPENTDVHESRSVCVSMSLHAFVPHVLGTHFLFWITWWILKKARFHPNNPVINCCWKLGNDVGPSWVSESVNGTH